MTSPLQRAYLDAMGIPVWLARDAARPEETGAPKAVPVQLGPGNGPVLLLCNSVDEPAGPLATDVVRAIGPDPVWGWPSAGEPGQATAEAITDGLFTHVLVLGEATRQSLFGDERPAQLGSAIILQLDSLEDLAVSAAARKSLWKALVDQGLARRRVTPGKGADQA